MYRNILQFVRFQAKPDFEPDEHASHVEREKGNATASILAINVLDTNIVVNIPAKAQTPRQTHHIVSQARGSKVPEAPKPTKLTGNRCLGQK
jgi:hypothetical protein